MLIYILFIIGLIIIDQISKYIMVSVSGNDAIIIIKNFFELDLCYNTGAAWSFLNDQPIFLFFVSLIGSVLLFFVFYKIKKAYNSKWLNIAAVLMISGAIGNGIDRMFHSIDVITNGNFASRFPFLNTSGVVDFLEFHINFFGSQFPTFNIADSFLTIGVIVMMIGVILLNDDNPKEKKTKKDEIENENN